MELKDFVTDFYKKYLELNDKILPTLSPTAQVVMNLLFSRTIGEGKQMCQLSHDNIHALTNLHIKTIRKAIEQCVKKGYTEVIERSDLTKAYSYKIIWPTSFLNDPKMIKFYRSPNLMLKEMGVEEMRYKNIVDRLTDDDRELLEILRRSLTSKEEAFLRKQAIKTKLTEEDTENTFLELIVLTRFGPERLRKYEVVDDEAS